MLKFGEWLRSQRQRCGLSIESTAKLAEISVGRLKSLELGLSGKRITRPEATRLASIYRVLHDEILDQAAKS